MKHLTTVFICFLLMESLFGQCSNFQYAPDTQALRQYLETYQGTEEPGFVLWVMHQDSVVFKAQQGLANLNSRQPIDENTLFYIASLSKTFTAAAVLKLWEQGALGLEDRLADHLAGLPDCMQEVRIFHLLNHTSGVPDYYDYLGEDLVDFDNTKVMNFVEGLDTLAFEPGVKYAYSNTAYVILAQLIEKVSGTSYANHLKEVFFDPLGMDATYVHVKGAASPNQKAEGYSFDEKEQAFVSDDYKGFYTYGAGGIYSSVVDLHKWYLGISRGNVLSDRSRALLWHFPVTSSGKSSWLGMGWTNETYGRRTPKLNGLKAIGAIGSFKGFRGMMKVFPDHDFGLILLSNRGSWPLDMEIGEAFFRKIN